MRARRNGTLVAAAAIPLLVMGCDGRPQAPAALPVADRSPPTAAPAPRPAPPPIVTPDAPTLTLIRAQIDELAASTDFQKRMELAGRLEKFGTAATLPILDRLSLEAPMACSGLAQSLRGIRDPRAIPALIAIVDAARAKQKNAPYVYGAARDADEFERDMCADAAITALGSLGDARAVDTLVAELARHRTSPTGDALGGIRDPRVIPALFAALPYDMNQSVEAGLGVFGREVLGPSRDALRSPDANVRARAVRFLSTSALIDAPSEVAPLLADPAPGVRVEAIEALGRLKNAPAGALLFPLLQDSAPAVRLAAAHAMIRGGDRRGQDTLVAELATHLSANLAERKRAYPGDLGRLIDDGHRLLRIAADAADERLAAAIVPFLDDWEPQLRERAAESLGRSGGPQAIAALVGGLIDWRSGPACAAALERLRWQPRSAVERVHFRFARRDGRSLGADWPQTLPVVREDLASKDPRAVRTAALIVIGLGRTELQPELIASLERQSTPALAEAMLNSGDAKLSEAARRWAQRRGYSIETNIAGGAIGWGAL